MSDKRGRAIERLSEENAALKSERDALREKVEKIREFVVRGGDTALYEIEQILK